MELVCGDSQRVQVVQNWEEPFVRTSQAERIGKMVVYASVWQQPLGDEFGLIDCALLTSVEILVGCNAARPGTADVLM